MVDQHSPGYLVFCQRNACTIEPYFPSRFARQFGYDQLYVGNSNLGLRFRGNLYERTRAWYFNGWRNRGQIQPPQKVPNSYASLRFCAWYVIENSVPGYNIKNTCIKKIKAMFQAKKGSKSTHLKGMGEFLQAEREADPTGAACRTQ